ncbi:MAG: NADH:flavin oxidoreductase [Candidatus Lambdaproteobacteria bacterium RIFOXYD1_FULL_56_27]|uniref:NADH:flavin oxidoreductase n=1 Tax=Candidatus Lambdaproteobacteria bacterium RIFOXYD2_FULL_56_26 TaxID=1817773 RepID=A0A1F6GLJ2_9PROT|nr:MAG: NADH:flavin oxidoreductase [Candidatus Lambdaproteobacteria bacterium RIFOXYD2_FULL_56_26]OGH05516.1 MAG: NADH:flavin oxidoreductase [Candidatus Lambdaproteobacteria bacterium RIFOXYC1_FULL_56_13]OGH09794.1 MAG: NADH:flavin oxidoreductase [Candidatus Lambdaproteobacteria bacterium RIFOXYD1_FULL_56_27]
MFDSFKLGNLRAKNRILVPPYHDGLAQKDGRVSHAIYEHVMRLVRQGAGVVILNSAYVTQQGKSHSLQLGIAEEDHLAGLKNLVKHIKAEGVIAGVRLSHAGAKTNEKICGEQPIGPSAINFGKDYDLSRPFDSDDVEELCLFYSHAIERAEEAGFDFVELNGAQQQLLDQCLHPRYNTREDEYGGKLENRLRLACEIIQAMKARVENRLMVGYFFSIHDKLEDGFNEKSLKTMIKTLEKAGVDLFHPITIHVMNKFFESEETLLEWVAKATDKSIIVEGNIKSTQVLKEVLAIDKATMYGIDKALFARPNWFQFLQKKIAG